MTSRISPQISALYFLLPLKLKSKAKAKKVSLLIRKTVLKVCFSFLRRLEQKIDAKIKEVIM